MKTVRILGIIVIVALIGNFIKDAIPGFIDGWNDAEAHHDLPAGWTYTSVPVKYYKGETARDSLFNQTLQCNVPAEATEVFTFIHHSKWMDIITIAFLPFALLGIYGFYCLIRLLLSVSRGEILIRKNIRRLRFFIYPMMGVSALFELNRYILYRIATSELVSSGYVFDEFHLKYSWTFMLVIALLTEIFAQAVRIKEENDLTI